MSYGLWPAVLVFLVVLTAHTFSLAQQGDTNTFFAAKRLKRFEHVRVDERNFARVQNLHFNWHGAAVKALIGQLGKELYQHIPKKEKLVLAQCLDNIDDKRDITLSARCLVTTRRRRSVVDVAPYTSAFKLDSASVEQPTKRSRRQQQQANNAANIHWRRPPNSDKRASRLHAAKMAAKTSYHKRREWKVKQAAAITNLPGEADRSPIVRVMNLISNFAPSLSNNASSTNNDNKTVPRGIKWQSVYRKLAALKARNDDQKRAPGARVYDMRMYDLVLDRRQPSMSPRQRKSPQGIMEMAFDLLTGMSGAENARRRKDSNINVLSPRFAPLMPNKAPSSTLQLSPTLFALYDDDENSEEPNELHDYDDSTSYEGDSTSQEASIAFHRASKRTRHHLRRRQAAIHQNTATSVRLRRLRGLDKKLKSDVKRKNANESGVPPVMPQNIASVPKLLKSSGLGSTDREAIISLLMDVSGAAKTVDDAVQFLEQLNFFDIEDEIFESHSHVDHAYDRLHDSLQEEQTAQLDRRGFTFVSRAQVERLVRDQSVNLSMTDVGLDRLPEFDNVAELEESLWKRIECIAENVADEECTADAFFMHRYNASAGDHMRGLYRHKRDLENPSILAPTVLAPFSFTPIFGLSVLGPVVLSPSLFAPLILNPAVLSPFVLSPSLGMPFILSPYVLTPYVLSPLVMAPFILNPYVLSPNVLNPYLLSPLILSPLVLCPDVLSPMALGGSILSPSVGSPAVLTETALMANWLSPTFLSR